MIQYKKDTNEGYGSTFAGQDVQAFMLESCNLEFKIRTITDLKYSVSATGYNALSFNTMEVIGSKVICPAYSKQLKLKI